MERVAAIDVGGTTIKAGILDAGGMLTHARRYPTTAEPEGLARQVAAIARDLSEVVERDGSPLLPTIGLGVPGVVDETRGVGVYSANLGWREAPLRELTATAVNRPVAFGHDVRCGALAEMAWGAGSPTMLYLAIGTGIGAAVVLDGVPWVNRGYAGEIGQSYAALDGRDVVVERYASARGISRQYAQRSGRAVSGAKEVFDAARAGDADAQATLEDAITLIARILSGALGVLGSMDIVLGGGLAEAGAQLTTPLTEVLEQRLRISPAPAITTASLGSWSQALGAGYLALRAEGVETRRGGEGCGVVVGDSGNTGRCQRNEGVSRV
ncbi:MAG: ROK family protein [Bowdeniella nasicola]|nr:ROK family protein [Bowdeniella nasicola]